MTILFKESVDNLTYSFNFEKDFKRNNKTIQTVHSNGKLSIHLKKFEEIANGVECIFFVDEYNLAGVKNPLIFNPTKWIIDIDNTLVYVKSKEHLKHIFDKFKNKNRKPENMANLLVTERLFFHTPFGFENAGFSNGPYLTFFLNYYNIDLEQDDLMIFGPRWYSIPINLPMIVVYRCKSITDQFVNFEGWISLDEEILNKSLTDVSFRSRAMDYHFSKDFSIDSKIDVCIDRSTSFLHFANFEFELKGNNGKLHELMKYSIKRDIGSRSNNNTRIIIGKPHIIDPW